MKNHLQTPAFKPKFYFPMEITLCHETSMRSFSQPFKQALTHLELNSHTMLGLLTQGLSMHSSLLQQPSTPDTQKCPAFNLNIASLCP